MAPGSPARPGPDEYLVWDLPGDACSVLLNLELAHALKRLAGRRSGADVGILLGSIVVMDQNRTLVTIEDCQSLRKEDDFPEHLKYWRTAEPGRLSAIGLVRAAGGGLAPAKFARETTTWFTRQFTGSPGVLLVMESVRGAIPTGRLAWSSSGALDDGTAWSEIPLDSARLRAGGFTIVQGSPAFEYGLAPEQAPKRTLRQWAWVPLAVALAGITAFFVWSTYRNVPEPVIGTDTATQEIEPSAPISEPKQVPPSKSIQNPGIPVDSQRPPSRNRERRPIPPAVIVEWHAAPEAITRKLANSGVGFPLLRRFRSKEVKDFVPPSPRKQVKPAVPNRAAGELPGEWQVNLRVTIDKSGRVLRATLLNASANREFVRLAQAAIDRWRFQPARLHNRAVPSAVDVTFRFPNAAPTQAERAPR